MSTIELDDDLVALLRRANRPASQAARELIVLELYRQGIISSGKAGQMLAISRWDFIQRAGQVGIAYHDMTEDEWAAERRHSEEL